MKKIAVILLVLAICHSAAYAQMVDSQGKRIDAFMFDEPPVLDGKLDDDIWAFSAVVTNLHQINPDEGAVPSEESQILVVYTKDALYIGARFFDREPDRIGALLLRQGDFSWGEDSITVMIDPLNSGRSGYAFDLTANGGELGEDIDAVGVLLDQPAHSGELALSPLEAGDEATPFIGGEFHEGPLEALYRIPPRGI